MKLHSFIHHRQENVLLVLWRHHFFIMSPFLSKFSNHTGFHFVSGLSDCMFLFSIIEHILKYIKAWLRTWKEIYISVLTKKQEFKNKIQWTLNGLTWENLRHLIYIIMNQNRLFKKYCENSLFSLSKSLVHQRSLQNFLKYRKYRILPSNTEKYRMDSKYRIIQEIQEIQEHSQACFDVCLCHK